MAEQQPAKQPAEALAEEDEFEEFDLEDWNPKQEDPADAQLWEQDWDDDNLNDDFALRLKEELAKQQQQA